MECQNVKTLPISTYFEQVELIQLGQKRVLSGPPPPPKCIFSYLRYWGAPDYAGEVPPTLGTGVPLTM
jgi:hypothetical protein